MSSPWCEMTRHTHRCVWMKEEKEGEREIRRERREGERREEREKRERESSKHFCELLKARAKCNKGIKCSSQFI